jgi:hypothetical protein
MSLTLQPVRVGSGSDEEGMLIFDADQRLMAVAYGGADPPW